MRDEGKSDTRDDPAGETPEDERPQRRRRRARRARGPEDAQGFGGFGGGMPNIMQLLPLLLAMGGKGFPGVGAVNFQLQLITWMIETWLDYLAAMQEVFEHALDRLQDLEWGGRGDDEGRDW